MKKTAVLTGIILAVFFATVIQAGSETICGCSGKISGNFRIVNKINECRWWENKVTFETGPGIQGPKGETGPRGPEGPQGKPGECEISKDEINGLTARIEALEAYHTPCSKGEYLGNYYIDSQEKLAKLKGYTKVDGSIIITGETLTSLEGLECLEDITGLLDIRYTSIKNLDGLKNLKSIGDSLIIRENKNLCQDSARNFGNRFENSNIDMIIAYNFGACEGQ